MAANGKLKSFINKQHLDEMLISLNSQRFVKQTNTAEFVIAALYCDVMMKVSGGTGIDIYAHSAVLAAASPYFAAFLSQDQPRAYCQKTPQVIEIHIASDENEECTVAAGAYERAVRDLVDYIYTGFIVVDPTTATSVLDLARVMQIDSVIKFCEDFLMGKLGDDGIYGISNVRTSENLEEGGNSYNVTPSIHVLSKITGLQSKYFLGYNSICPPKVIRKNSVSTQVRPSLLGIQAEETGEEHMCHNQEPKPVKFQCLKRSAATQARRPMAETMSISEDVKQQKKVADLITNFPFNVKEASASEPLNVIAFSREKAVLHCAELVTLKESEPCQLASLSNDKEALAVIMSSSVTPVAVRHSMRARRKTFKLAEGSEFEEHVSSTPALLKKRSSKLRKKIQEVSLSKPSLAVINREENGTISSNTQQVAEDVTVKSLIIGANINSGSNCSLTVGETVVFEQHSEEENICVQQLDSEDDDDENPDIKTDLDEDIDAVSPKFRCSKCDFTTKNARERSIHNHKHWSDLNICYYCETKFEDSASLDAHCRRKHMKQKMPFVCRSCSQQFRSRSRLTLHLTKHSDDRPYVCHVCHGAFKWKNSLKNHMITHGNRKEHLCDVCGYATAHRYQLMSHRLVHTGDTMRCPYIGCDYRSTKSQNLKYHLLTHTLEKAHQCEVCGQSFSLIKNMKRHMLLHTSLKNHKCTQCGFASTRYDKLKEHLHKSHSLGTAPERRIRITDLIHLNEVLPQIH